MRVCRPVGFSLANITLIYSLLSSSWKRKIQKNKKNINTIACACVCVSVTISSYIFLPIPPGKRKNLLQITITLLNFFFYPFGLSTNFLPLFRFDFSLPPRFVVFRGACFGWGLALSRLFDLYDYFVWLFFFCRVCVCGNDGCFFFPLTSILLLPSALSLFSLLQIWKSSPDYYTIKIHDKKNIIHFCCKTKLWKRNVSGRKEKFIWEEIKLLWLWLLATSQPIL